MELHEVMRTTFAAREYTGVVGAQALDKGHAITIRWLALTYGSRYQALMRTPKSNKSSELMEGGS